ncbi:MAG: FAD-binding oxidoreductase [Bacteroidetes bacterium]|nr:FAD-binding oxidoreductase [Bacteroidota bacterium]
MLPFKAEFMAWSFWQIQELNKNYDLTIVGAGFTGLHTAIAFKRKYPKASVLIVDQGLGVNAASNRNAGFACFGSPTELLANYQHLGRDAALTMAQKRREGIEFLAHTYGKACDYVPVTSHELFLDAKHDFEHVVSELKLLNADLKSVGFATETFKPSLNAQLEINQIEICGEGQLNPAKLHNALLDNCRAVGIQFCNAKFIDHQLLQDDIAVELEGGMIIKTTALVLATNGFSNTTNIKPARAQVLITEPIYNLQLEGNYHFDKGYYYLRNVGDRVLFGGGRNLDFETETTTDLSLNEFIQSHLENLLRNKLLQNVPFQIAHKWAGIMGIRQDGTPKVEVLGNHIFRIEGMSGMGVALSPVLAQELVELL